MPAEVNSVYNKEQIAHAAEKRGIELVTVAVSAAALVPELNILYAIVGEGHCARHARFEAKPGAGAVKLTELADTWLEIVRPACRACVLAHRPQSYHEILDDAVART